MLLLQDTPTFLYVNLSHGNAKDTNYAAIHIGSEEREGLRAHAYMVLFCITSFYLSLYTTCIVLCTIFHQFIFIKFNVTRKGANVSFSASCRGDDI